MYLYLCFKNKYRHICIKYITKLLRLVLIPCYRMMKSGTFSKRSGAATTALESCEFWFQVAFFILNTFLYFVGIVCMYVWKKIIAKFVGTVYPFGV